MSVTDFVVYGGSASPVLITTNRETIGRVAMGVYRFASIAEAIAAGYRCEGGAALLVYEVSQAELDSGLFVMDGEYAAAPVVIAEAGRAIIGQKATPVFVINA